MRSAPQTINDMIADCEQSLVTYDRKRATTHCAALRRAARRRRLRRLASGVTIAALLTPAVAVGWLWGTLAAAFLLAVGVAVALPVYAVIGSARTAVATEASHHDGEQWPGQYEYWTDVALLQAHYQTLRADVETLNDDDSYAREHAAARAARVAMLMEAMNAKWVSEPAAA